jgi:hypothetical protein
MRFLPWAVRAVLALGVAASVTANVLHARDNLISQAIAAWPPLALLVTVELVTRIPVYRKTLAVFRILATVAIAGIAAWISYHHMVAVVARYGETGTVPYLLPLSVDGLIGRQGVLERLGRVLFGGQHRGGVGKGSVQSRRREPGGPLVVAACSVRSDAPAPARRLPTLADKPVPGFTTLA